MTKRFFVGVLAILGLYTLSAWGISHIAHYSTQDIDGLIFSAILSTVNVILAYGIIRLAMDKDQKTFSKIFLGGLIGRLLLLFVAIWIIFNFTVVNRFIFIGSLFILYFLYQIWEVLILYSKYK